MNDNHRFRPLPGAARSIAVVLLLTTAGACSFRLEDKPGSKELITAREQAELGDRATALDAINAGIAKAEDPTIVARLHYDRARLLDRRGGADPQEILRELMIARRGGYAPATMFMAELQETGRLGTAHPDSAVALYEEARAFEPRASIALARLAKQEGIRTTVPVERLISEGLAGLEAQSEAGQASAVRELARVYTDGVLVAPNPRKAEALLAQGVKLGDVSALTDLAMIWIQRPDPVEKRRARRMLESAADRGARGAMVEIAKRHRDGSFGEPNMAEAAHWFRRAIAANEKGIELDLADALLRMPQPSETNVAEAVDLIDGAVQGGDPEAALMRGRLFAQGVGGPSDPSRAADMYEIARASRLPDASVELGRLYAQGQGVQKDPTRAVTYWQEALDRGATSVYKDLGEAYANGTGVAADPARASRYLTVAAEGGSISAATTLAGLYESGIDGSPDRRSAEKWYQFASDRGSVSAANSLAALYERGIDGPPNLGKALPLYEVAAERGSGSAMGRLIEIYGDPASGFADRSRQIHWLTAAADSGSGGAMFALAKAYASGAGVPRDPARAEGLLARLYASDPGSAASIARGYADGTLGVRDQTVAVAWYRRAADQGDSRSMRAIAEAYEEGRGVAANSNLATSWYARASDAGDVIATRRLGDRIMASGEEGAARRAVSLWRRAAAQGDVAAMRSLGQALAVGLADEIDSRQALRWYEAAARAGDGESQYQAGMMYLQGLGVERDPERARSWLLAARRNNVEMAEAGLQTLATVAR